MQTTTGWRLAALLGPFCAIALAASTAAAQSPDPCATQNPRLTRARSADRDYDGLSNCRERYQLGTSPRDPDSDDDGMDDGEEVAQGSDPLDADSDDDGREDGEEHDLGTDPGDPDSDDDGDEDGEDADPADQLADAIEGDAQTISCGSAPSLVVLGIPIQLNAATEYHGVQDCSELAALLAAGGRVHVEVHVTGDLSTALVAREITLEDRDGDGSPEEVDEDDDDDGTADDDDGENDDDRDDEQDDDDEEEDDDAGRRVSGISMTAIRPQRAARLTR